MQQLQHFISLMGFNIQNSQKISLFDAIHLKTETLASLNTLWIQQMTVYTCETDCLAFAKY